LTEKKIKMPRDNFAKSLKIRKDRSSASGRRDVAFLNRRSKLLLRNSHETLTNGLHSFPFVLENRNPMKFPRLSDELHLAELDHVLRNSLRQPRRQSPLSKSPPQLQKSRKNARSKTDDKRTLELTRLRLNNCEGVEKSSGDFCGLVPGAGDLAFE
jgi:hypothetical protein